MSVKVAGFKVRTRTRAREWGADERERGPGGDGAVALRRSVFSPLETEAASRIHLRGGGGGASPPRAIVALLLSLHARSPSARSCSLLRAHGRSRSRTCGGALTVASFARVRLGGDDFFYGRSRTSSSR